MMLDKFLFYTYIIYILVCFIFSTFSINCIELYSTIPNIVSYAVGILYLILKWKNMVSNRIKKIFLNYFFFQFFYNGINIYTLLFRKDCAYIDKVDSEVILYFFLMISNIVLYIVNIEIINKTQVPRIEFIPMEVV